MVEVHYQLLLVGPQQSEWIFSHVVINGSLILGIMVVVGMDDSGVTTANLPMTCHKSFPDLLLGLKSVLSKIYCTNASSSDI